MVTYGTKIKYDDPNRETLLTEAYAFIEEHEDAGITDNNIYVEIYRKSKEEYIYPQIVALKKQLSDDDSPIGDWKNLKQLDTGAYTEEEMAEYRLARAMVRERINELEEELETELESN